MTQAPVSHTVTVSASRVGSATVVRVYCLSGDDGLRTEKQFSRVQNSIPRFVTVTQKFELSGFFQF